MAEMTQNTGAAIFPAVSRARAQQTLENSLDLVVLTYSQVAGRVLELRLRGDFHPSLSMGPLTLLPTVLSVRCTVALRLSGLDVSFPANTEFIPSYETNPVFST